MFSTATVREARCFPSVVVAGLAAVFFAAIVRPASAPGGEAPATAEAAGSLYLMEMPAMSVVFYVVPWSEDVQRIGGLGWLDFDADKNPNVLFEILGTYQPRAGHKAEGLFRFTSPKLSTVPWSGAFDPVQKGFRWDVKDGGKSTPLGAARSLPPRRTAADGASARQTQARSVPADAGSATGSPAASASPASAAAPSTPPAASTTPTASLPATSSPSATSGSTNLAAAARDGATRLLAKPLDPLSEGLLSGFDPKTGEIDWGKVITHTIEKAPEPRKASPPPNTDGEDAMNLIRGLTEVGKGNLKLKRDKDGNLHLVPKSKTGPFVRPRPKDASAPPSPAPSSTPVTPPTTLPADDTSKAPGTSGGIDSGVVTVIDVGTDLLMGRGDPFDNLRIINQLTKSAESKQPSEAEEIRRRIEESKKDKDNAPQQPVTSSPAAPPTTTPPSASATPSTTSRAPNGKGVPKVVGLSFANAMTALWRAGLDSNSVTCLGHSNDPNKAGRVVGQTPPPYSPYPPDRQVALQYYAGAAAPAETSEATGFQPGDAARILPRFDKQHEQILADGRVCLWMEFKPGETESLWLASLDAPEVPARLAEKRERWAQIDRGSLVDNQYFDYTVRALAAGNDEGVVDWTVRKLSDVGKDSTLFGRYIVHRGFVISYDHNYLETADDNAGQAWSTILENAKQLIELRFPSAE